MRPSVSIILTTYNVERYVEESLLSVCNQTLRNVEIIVVDDGSNDRTPELLRQMAEKDSRIQLILLEKNTIGGVATPANIGVDKALGEYIGFADGDDIYDRTAFEKLYNAAKKYDADISICNYVDFESKTLEVSKSSDCNIWGHIPPEDFIIANVWDKKKLLEMSPVPWRKLYKSSFVKKKNIRFPEVDYFFEDNPLHWEVILNCSGVAFVREVLCYHRMNRIGQTMSTGNLKVIDIFNHYNVMKDICEKAIDNISFLDRNNKCRSITGDNGRVARKKQTTLMPQLLRWIVIHCYWTAEMVGPANYAEVMKKSRTLLESFSRAEILEVHRDGIINYADLRLIHAIKTNNKSCFSSVIQRKSVTFRSQIMFKLHYHGVGHVLKAGIARLNFKKNSLKNEFGHLNWRIEANYNEIVTIGRRQSLLELLDDMRQEKRQLV